jgi:hypothetical protein
VVRHAQMALPPAESILARLRDLHVSGADPAARIGTLEQTYARLVGVYQQLSRSDARRVPEQIGFELRDLEQQARTVAAAAGVPHCAPNQI